MKRILPNPSVIVLLLMTVLTGGCANPVMPTLADTLATRREITIPPPAPPAPAEVKPREELKIATGNRKKFSLTVKDADINSVLLMMSKESGVPIIPERGISGPVSITIDKMPLGDVLYAVIKPLGYTATLENGIIIVGRPKLATRTFQINYIKDKRETRSNTNVSVFGTGSTDGTSSSSSSTNSYGSGSGNVNVTTSGTADFWGSIEGALEMMVFGTTGGGRREASGFVRGEGARKLDMTAKQSLNESVDTKGWKGQQGQKTSAAEFKAELVDTNPESIEYQQQADEKIGTRLAENTLKNLLVNEIAGIIQVTDYPDNLDRIARFLDSVERSIKRQVLIQTHIMEVTLNDFYSLGIDWSVIAGQLTISQGLAPLLSTNTFKIAATNEHFNTLVDAMKEQGQVKMLSSPKVIAMNNQKAVIKLTTKEVSWTTTTTQYRDNAPVTDTVAKIDEVGIFLDVTPQIDGDGKITMQVHPSVSEVKKISVSPDGKSNKPVIDVREIDTMIDSRSGETIVIAGLIVDKLHETKRSVPLLGDIPYLGVLFSYSEQKREKTELVIFLTPFYLNLASIEDIRKEHEKRLHEFGETFNLINNLGSLVTERAQVN